jgi:hypothetical protein
MNSNSTTPRTTPALTFALACVLVSGCSSFGLMGVPAIPAHRVPPTLLNQNVKQDLIDISMTRLRQDPPEYYQLGAGDVLGIYIQNVLGSDEEPPPVHFSESGDKPPAIGYPIPVREDGTIALPLVDEIYVEGKSLEEATMLIRREYTVNRSILLPGNDRIIVTLIRKRQHRVLVVREESGGVENVAKRGAGYTIDLDVYENDLLHALNATGGMPGVDARSDILIFRGLHQSGVHRDELIAQVKAGKLPCHCPPGIPDDPSVVRIPIKYHPSNPPQFSQEDIILKTGDIVMIESRDSEKYYTGGALAGGEFLLPRDEDLDVLGAIAIAGGTVGPAGFGLSSLGSGAMGAGGGGPRAAAGKSPSRAIVLRRLCDGGQVAIRIDLNRALTDPRQRILIQPEDTIIVQYTLGEEIYNAALNLLQFNFLFNGFRGGGF